MDNCGILGNWAALLLIFFVDMKLILDFIPNHTSRKHPWFKKSAKNESGYADYYIWHPGFKSPAPLNRAPPNNWVS